MTPIYSIQWLITELEKGHTLKFIYFWGHTPNQPDVIDKSCLSQWYEAPFTVDGITYKTSEHWMMAQKALLFNDTGIFHKIVNAHKPGEAKDLGRQVTGFDEQIWNEKRYDIVIQGNFQKFSQHQDLLDFLLKTENRVLVEASPIDKIWGIGLAHDDKRIDDVQAWQGLNLLGFALMEVRDLLKPRMEHS